VILKTTKPGKHQEPLRFERYPSNEKVCIVNCLEKYLKKTDPGEFAGPANGTLLLSYAYPHNPVGNTTIARYVKLF